MIKYLKASDVHMLVITLGRYAFQLSFCDIKNAASDEPYNIIGAKIEEQINKQL